MEFKRLPWFSISIAEETDVNWLFSLRAEIRSWPNRFSIIEGRKELSFRQITRSAKITMAHGSAA
jgi:hypothetical protein